MLPLIRSLKRPLLWPLPLLSRPLLTRQAPAQPLTLPSRLQSTFLSLSQVMKKEEKDLITDYANAVPVDNPLPSHPLPPRDITPESLADVPVETLNHWLHQYVLNKKVRPKETARISRRLFRHHPAPNSASLSYVMTMLLRAFSTPAQLQVFMDGAKARGIVPDIVCYNIILSSYKSRGDPIPMLAIIRRAHAEGLPIGIRSWAPYLQCLAKGGKATAVDEALREMEAHGTVCDTIAYNGILYGFRSHALLEDMDRVFLSMRSKGIPLNATTWYLMIDAYLLAKDPGQALEIFREAVEADLISGDAIYSLMSAVPGEEILEIIRTHSPTPITPAIANALICAAVKMNDFARAFRLLASLRTVDGFAPDTVTYGAILDAYGKDQNAEGALSLLTAIRAEGIPLDVISYNSVMTALRGRHDMATPLRLLDEMRAEGIAPNIYVYNSALVCASSAQDGPAAVMLMRRLLKEGLTPDYRTVNYLFRALGEAKAPARVVWREWKAIRELPGALNFISSLHILSSLGADPTSPPAWTVELLREVLAHIASDNCSLHFTQSIIQLASRDCIDETLEVWREARGVKVPVGHEALAAVLDVCRRLERWDTAETIWDQAVPSLPNLDVSEDSSTLLIRARAELLATSSRWKEAEAILSRLPNPSMDDWAIGFLEGVPSNLGSHFASLFSVSPSSKRVSNMV